MFSSVRCEGAGVLLDSKLGGGKFSLTPVLVEFVLETYAEYEERDAVASNS
jgi:hypothetical protein